MYPLPRPLRFRRVSSTDNVRLTGGRELVLYCAACIRSSQSFDMSRSIKEIAESSDASTQKGSGSLIVLVENVMGATGLTALTDASWIDASRCLKSSPTKSRDLALKEVILSTLPGFTRQVCGRVRLLRSGTLRQKGPSRATKSAMKCRGLVAG